MDKAQRVICFLFITSLLDIASSTFVGICVKGGLQDKCFTEIGQNVQYIQSKSVTLANIQPFILNTKLGGVHDVDIFADYKKIKYTLSPSYGFQDGVVHIACVAKCNIIIINFPSTVLHLYCSSNVGMAVTTNWNYAGNGIFEATEELKLIIINAFRQVLTVRVSASAPVFVYTVQEITPLHTEVLQRSGTDIGAMSMQTCSPNVSYPLPSSKKVLSKTTKLSTSTAYTVSTSGLTSSTPMLTNTASTIQSSPYSVSTVLPSTQLIGSLSYQSQKSSLESTLLLQQSHSSTVSGTPSLGLRSSTSSISIKISTTATSFAKATSTKPQLYYTTPLPTATNTSSNKTTALPSDLHPNTVGSCLYCCVPVMTFNISDPDQKKILQEKVKKLKKLLAVNKKNLSLTKRKHYSIPDYRTSSRAIGMTGIGILASFGVLILTFDLPFIFKLIVK